MTTVKGHQAKIGVLWGDFPWDEPPPRIGKLLSYGVIGRNVTRALCNVGKVIPFEPSQANQSSDDQLGEFLRGIDVLWCDLYPNTHAALAARSQQNLSFQALLFAAGTMPKAAEGVFFQWQRLIRPTDTLLFTSRADREIWHRLTDQSSVREYVLPLAVDDTVFTHRPGARQRVCGHLELPMDVPILLYVGRINIQKNIHLLLHILSTVQDVFSDTQLLIVGEEDTISLNEFNVPNTGYKEWLVDLATDLGVADSVHFLGAAYSEFLADVYAGSDVLVNLSMYHRENFGLSQAEAQACGLPVVCSAWGGFKDVICHGETGFFVDAIMTKNGIRVDWLTAAHRVMELFRNPDMRTTFRTKAIQRAKKHFGIDALSCHLSDVLSQVEAPLYEKDTPYYEPSQLALDYECHKKASGWYDDNDWYTGMFQGHDYVLYEQLIGPYATRLASELKPEEIRLEWVPYRISPVQTIPSRRLVCGLDPIWPTHIYLDELGWKVFSLTDKQVSVEEIIQRITDMNPDASPHSVVQQLCRLHWAGLVLFTAKA